MAKSFRIGSRSIGKGSCFIIAEAGSNHNGDIKTAKRLISEAARIGADAIKFQLFEAEKLSSQGNVQEILSTYEFKRDWLLPLNEYAKSKGIIMFATPFDKEAVGLLKKIKSPVYKVASADLTNTVLIKQIAVTRKPIICSVGLANMQEIKETIDILSSLGNTKLALLHCITNYPTLIEELNLRVIKTLIDKFKVPVGFSDHTMDTNIPSVAVALGASIVEKHLTLFRKMEGPDHPFALEPSEFMVMVENIRNAEKSLGTGIKTIINSEKNGLKTGRRSLYTSRDIPKGSIMTHDAISILRPCHEIEPKDMDKVVGKRTKKKISAFKPILARHIENKASLTVVEGLPEGTYYELISLKDLKIAHELGEEGHRSELCTLYMFETPDKFNIQRLRTGSPKLQRPEIRLTVDYPEDLIVVREVYNALKIKGEYIKIESIIDYLDLHPKLKEVNGWIDTGTGRIWD